MTKYLTFHYHTTEHTNKKAQITKQTSKLENNIMIVNKNN